MEKAVNFVNEKRSSPHFRVGADLVLFNSICIEILMEGVFVCYFAKHAVFKMGSI